MEQTMIEQELKGLYQILKDRDPNAVCVLATVLEGIHQGGKCLCMDGCIRWTDLDEDFLRRNRETLMSVSVSQLLELEGSRVFCEVIGGRKDLVICGAGHVSIPIILLGKQLGFHVTVMDDRPLFADRAREAGADQVYCDAFEHALEQIPGSRDTYYVIVTRGHRYDIDCLRLALGKPHAYIGMMGSRKRVHLVKQQLTEEGFDAELLEQVHAPIGLAIGAETPEEISVSILAEMIQIKNAGKRISGYDRELLSCLTGSGSPEGGVLCTIVEKHGSAPREAGTKMLILEDGSLIGTIGGGCAESSIIQKGLYMLREEIRTPELVSVDMTGREAEDLGMVCGGTILVYMEYVKKQPMDL